MEQEPETQNLDPSIDPSLLIVGEQAAGDHPETLGMIAAAEHDPDGMTNIQKHYEDAPDTDAPGGLKQVESGTSFDKVELVSGLPVIGADEEKRVRELPSNEQFRAIKPGFIAESWTPMTDKEKEPFFDKAGEDAMATEVGNRAVALLDKNTSEDLVKQVREAAEASFKAELESKKVEKQKIADDKARELLAKIQGGTPIDEILPKELTDGETQPDTSSPKD